MTDDLDALVDAYRTEVDAPPQHAETTRRSILRAARMRRQRRTLAVAASIALALVLTNATTFAWSTGRIDAMQRAAWSWVAGEARETVREAPPRRRAPAVVSVPVQPAEVDHMEIAAAAPEPTRADPADVPAPSARRLRGTNRTLDAEPTETEPTEQEPTEQGPTETEPSETEPSETEPTDALEAELDALTPPPSAERLAFERAHRMHFEAGDYPGALSAWTAYLAAYPAGRLIPEARFNRAVCLLRLSRFAQAEEALSRIARAGGHRARDAEGLLRALEDGRIRPHAP